MAGGTGTYLSIAGVCAAAYIFIILVSKLQQRNVDTVLIQALIISPDVILVLMAVPVGLVLLHAFKTNLDSNPNVQSMLAGINLFLIPMLILKDTVSLYEGSLLCRPTVNFVYGILNTLVTVFATYFSLDFAVNSKYLDGAIFPKGKLMATSFILNLGADTGFQMCRTVTNDVRIYKIIRERFTIGFMLVCAGIYGLRDDIPRDTNGFNGFLQTLQVLVVSSILGILFGVLLSLIQNRSKCLTDNPMLDMQFVLIFGITANMIAQVDSDTINEEIVMVLFGIMVGNFCKFNLGPLAVRRFIYVLELLAKLAKLVVLVIVGILLAEPLSTKSAWRSVGIFYMILIPASLVIQLVVFLICKATGLGQIKFGLKEFFLLYTTSMSKGPLSFIIAKKYFSQSTKLLDQIDFFLFTGLILFDPIAYLTARFFPKEDDLTLEEEIKTSNEVFDEEKSSSFVCALRYFIENLLSPILIYEYQKRKEADELLKIVSIQDHVISRTTISLSKPGGTTKQKDVSR